MFVLSNFLMAAARILDSGLSIIYWLIIIRALISWVNPDPHNFIVQILYKTTEPVLYPIRKILPLDFKFGIDISALIAILTIMFLQSFLVKTLIDWALKIR